MNTRRTALLDGDIIAYQSAAWAFARQIDGVDLRERVISQAQDWINRAFCTNVIVTISCNREDNYRRDFWPKYKAHRDDHVDPPGREDAVNALMEEYPSIRKKRIEADDLMGILGSSPTMPDGSIPVIVTVDKDLRQIPGWHFNPDKDDFPVRVDQEEADRWFYRQWLTGDATDNIPGLFKWGPVKAEKLLAQGAPSEWADMVLDAYRSHPAGYPKTYPLAMARCVRILRDAEWDKAKQEPILWTP